MNDEIVQSSLVVVPIFLYKMAILVIGYLIVKMGFTLLREGIKGEFKFKADIAGYKADLASASPGTFFVLLGVALLALAVLSKNHFSFDTQRRDQAEFPNSVAPDPLPKKLPEGFNG